MSDAIVLEGLRKTFGAKVAVDDLALRVPRGAIYGFIGPNGAGKTTTIRLIMSILFPDRGKISVLGHDSALDAKDRIGYLPEERGIYKKMKVSSYLGHIGRLKGADDGLKAKIHRWLEKVELSDVAGKKCEELSKGMQQKIQFIAAVIHEPDLLILDEPFSGLDPVNMRLLRKLIVEAHDSGTTVIFSTHVMVQAEEICDHIVMIHDGKKVLDDSLAEIRNRFDPRAILYEPVGDGFDASALVGGAVADARKEKNHWLLQLVDGADPHEAMRRIVDLAAPARLELHRPSLEDIFIEIVAGSGGATAASLRDSLRAPAAQEAS